MRKKRVIGSIKILTFGKMETSMRGSGEMNGEILPISGKKDMVFTLMRVEIGMKENGVVVKKEEQELIIIQVETDMKGSGTMITRTV